MGRRDGPKLDELKRLLRRLENIEAGQKSDDSRKAAPEPSTQGSGYVGALRGAAPIESAEGPHASRNTGTAGASDQFNEPTQGRLGSRASGTAPIIIGAATAAVVSSIIVGLLLWSGGGHGEKRSNQQRLSFAAATGPEVQGSGSTAPAARSDADVQTPGEAQALLQRADLQIRNGNLSEAHDLLEQAAKLGSGVAALTLGAMYDPARVAEFGDLGVKPDATLARAWYERAKALGVVEANDRLSELARK